MKGFLRKAAAVIAAAAMSISICAAVSAKNIFDDSTAIKSNTKYTREMSSEFGNDKDTHMFSIEVEKSGEMVFNATSYIDTLVLNVYNEDGTEIERSDSKTKSGLVKGIGSKGATFKWNSKTGIYKGTITYDVEPGTYYILISPNGYCSGGKYSFYIKTPGSSEAAKENASKSSSDATIMLNMLKGDKIDLSAVSSGKVQSSAKWSTSDSKVAKVSSKGIITAVGKGTCTITWKSGKTSFSVYINVE